MLVTNDASHPMCCASSFIVEHAVQLEQGQQVVRRDVELGRDRLPDRAYLLDQARERIEDVPVQRRCRVFSPRVRSLDLMLMTS